MVKCDGCKLFCSGSYECEGGCMLGGETECRKCSEIGTYENAWIYYSNDCPLSRIVLKDGTVFEPEVVDD